MNDLEKKNLPFVKFLIPIIFLFATFFFANSIAEKGIILSFFYFLFAAVSGFYLLYFSTKIKLLHHLFNLVKICTLSIILLIVIYSLAILTNNFRL